MSSRFIQLLIGNRWIFAIFLLPLSVCYDIFWYIRSNYVLWQGSAPGEHEARVENVQRQVKNWQIEGNGRKMCTARPTWMSITQQRINYKDHAYKVQVNLMDVLEVNTEKKYVRCEPLVTIRRLVDYLIPLGWTVPIVPEVGDLTIGGLVMGGGIESTSHKYGLWQFICTSYELVLSDGSVVEATKDNEHSDLYYGIPWSYGTLGFLTAVNLQIIPYKKYVKLEYFSTYPLDETMDIFKRETLLEGQNDSVEGIMFTKETGVIMTGNFTDYCDDRSKINKIGLWFKPWFYQHVETFLKKNRDEKSKSSGVEYIPTYDFFFRHHKPYYWLSHCWIPFGTNIIFRYLFGWTLPYNFGLLKFLREKIFPPNLDSNFVLQDYGIPLKGLKHSIEFYHDVVNIYPIWLCPARAMDTGPVNSLKQDDPMHIDVGLYGFSPIPGYDSDRAIQAMEKYAIEHKGYVGLYAETHLTYEEFNEMFDHSLYNRLKNEIPFCNQAFPTVYEKISKLGRSK